MKIDFSGKIGMSLIEEDVWILIKDIIFKDPGSYQRTPSNKRMDRIRTSIETHNYLSDKNLILNEKYEIVDGQHRLLVLSENGYEKVKCSIYSYDTPQDEWKHFCLLNNYNPTLGTKDDWHAKFGAGEPIANLIYKLNSDEDSILCGKIHLQGYEGKWKLKIPQAPLLINYSVGYYKVWAREREKIIYTKLSNFNYDNIRQNINRILGWFQSTYDLPSESNINVYKAGTFQQLLRFYRALEKQHKLGTDKGKESSIRRMKSFNFDNPSYRSADDFTKFMMLGAFYNRKASRVSDKLRLDS